MAVQGSAHIVPTEQVLDLWASGMSGVRIASRVTDERGDHFTEKAVRQAIIDARDRGDPRAIAHKPGARKKDWRG